MTIMEQHTTIAEQELLTMLSQLCPVAIHITSHRWQDGSTVYAWQAWESRGTHPTLLYASMLNLRNHYLRNVPVA